MRLTSFPCKRIRGSLLQAAEETRRRKLDEMTELHSPFNCTETEPFASISGLAKLGLCSQYQVHLLLGIIADYCTNSYMEIVHTEA